MREHQDWHRKKQYLKSIADIFKNPQDLRANDKASLAIILKKMITKAIIDDFQQLNRLETSDIQVIDPIARKRIRMNNRKTPFLKAKYLSDDFNVIEFCKNTMSTLTNSIGLGQEIAVMAQVLRLISITLEYGLWDIKDGRHLMKVFFLRTEQLHKQEEYINQKKMGFEDNIYKYLMICKEHSASILVQIITLVYDEWFFHKAIEKEDTTQLENILDSFDKIKKTFAFKLKQKAPELPPQDYVLFNEDKQYYSFFSFTMFNYLLYTLRKDGVILSTPKYRRAMHHLLMYVYDYHNDPFSLGSKLLKKGYLTYYLTGNIEEEYVKEGEKIGEELRVMISAYRKMRNKEGGLLNYDSKR